MAGQNVGTQNIFLRSSTYTLAYSDANNVFIEALLFVQNEMKGEAVKI